MKDYPEAQEILQALGRKRLMEVKASARQPPHKEHHHGHGHGTEKGLVDKIKSEAKVNIFNVILIDPINKLFSITILNNLNNYFK